MSVEAPTTSATVSALVIAKDEERDLPGCLESLREIADEIVVLVDDSTTDATEDIARKAGCRVERRRFDDYARQRQAALELCTKDWVLWLDCDERAPRGLKPGEGAAAFELPFRVTFLGRELRWGGLGSETHVRLFRRTQARFVGGALHEGLEIEGATAFLDAPVAHEPYKTISEYLEKLDRYTTLAAQKKRAAGKRFRWYHHLVLPGELMKRLVLRLAFLDGWQGVTYACLSAFHHWLKYAKLKEMEQTR